MGHFRHSNRRGARGKAGLSGRRPRTRRHQLDDEIARGEACRREEAGAPERDDADAADDDDGAAQPSRHVALVSERGRAWAVLAEGTQSECLSAVMHFPCDLLDLPAKMSVVRLGGDPETEWVLYRTLGA
jgi:hypothetical protein